MGRLPRETGQRALTPSVHPGVAGHDAAVSSLPASALQAPITVPVGRGTTAEVRKLDFLWLMLSDQIHHRGLLSVYTRMAGGKVPSTYGPSGDEPWF